MPKLFEVDVRRTEIGVVEVWAANAKEAISKVNLGIYKAREFWTSTEVEPLEARAKFEAYENEIALANI